MVCIGTGVYLASSPPFTSSETSVPSARYIISPSDVPFPRDKNSPRSMAVRPFMESSSTLTTFALAERVGLSVLPEPVTSLHIDSFPDAFVIVLASSASMCSHAS